ncbi:MAG: hypothetical protein A2134_02555 [Candidatus Woykebacteria bacterium RBG_16_39_9b]|uniref:Cation efflux protein transmembrane domain-containing protein n=1 Tax=Candidatus Woykebacteria bacterium RBG_16_39_9b TaxID=1802595 RepID=A0A1G1WEK1_9BACT|nr:MAG: hypothetical protein A2134_02555 [Candidatus Woykebacteria bacterium RBG_16_39_9b]
MLLAVAATGEYIGFHIVGSLPLAAHLMDVGGDLAAYSIACLTAFYSWFRDMLGREHKENHTEDVLAASFNTLGIAVVATLMAGRVYDSFTDPDPPEREWLVLLAPTAAFFVYWAIHWILDKMEESNINIEALEAHVVSDRLTSAVVFCATLATLILRTSWINPIGGMVVIAVLVWVFASLIRKIRNSMRNIGAS